MNFPKKWNVLNIPSDASAKYLFGVDYSVDSFHYSLYLTNLSNVWIADVDETKLKLKAIQNGIQLDSLNSIYQTLIVSFENNFNGDDTETHIELTKSKIDRDIPLELTLELVKVYDSAKLRWNFDLTILPDSSAISVFRGLIFNLSTIVFSLNEYKNDLVRQLEHKDGAIRYLSESIDGLNASHIITKWAPENSMNSRTMKTFDGESFDRLWKEKKLEQIENQYIWNLLQLNSTNNTYAYGMLFKYEDEEPQENVQPKLKDRKRSLDDDFLAADEYDDLSSTRQIKRVDSPMKKRRTEPLNDLTADFQEYDLQRDSQDSSRPSSKESSAPAFKSPSNPPSSPTKEGEEERKQEHDINTTKASEKRKRGFGVSRKRRVSQKEFSPIKAPKHFQSDD